MAHALAFPFKKTRGIRKRGAREEANARMGAKRIDIAEGDIPDAGGRPAVMQKLAHVGAAIPHQVEPGLGREPEPVERSRKPGVNCGVAFDGARKAKDVAHSATLRRFRAAANAPANDVTISSSDRRRVC